MVLVAHYPLQEESGSTAYDIRGNNNGTNNGATQGANGILGTSAYDFTASNIDYIECGNIGFEGLSNFTISYWVNVESIPNRAFITVNGGSSANDTFYFGHRNGNWDGQVNSGSVNITGSSVTTGEWKHLALTHDSGNGSVLYLDGIEDATSGTVSSVNSTPETFKLGGRDDNSALDGRIADVRIYDHALAASEVQYLYDVVASPSTIRTTRK